MNSCIQQKDTKIFTIAISGYSIMESSLYFLFSVFSNFCQWRFIAFISGKTKNAFLKKEACMGKIHTQSSQKTSWECMLSYSMHSDLMWLRKLALGNRSSDQNIGKVNSEFEFSFLHWFWARSFVLPLFSVFSSLGWVYIIRLPWGEGRSS